VVAALLMFHIACGTCHFIRYMQFSHDNHHLSLTELADYSKISKFHFIRLFSEATGRTPYQYIQHRRIERERLLLMTTKMSVAEVGATVGLFDAPNFSRTFSKHTGLSPTQFRMQSS